MNLYTEELKSVNWNQQTVESSPNIDFFTASWPHSLVSPFDGISEEYLSRYPKKPVVLALGDCPSIRRGRAHGACTASARRRDPF